MQPNRKRNRSTAKNIIEDNKLINRCLSGDQEAHAILMEKYKNAVFHIILKLVKNKTDAEDIMIETFEKAFRRLAKFKQEFVFSSWIFKIASNTSIDFIRKRNALAVRNLSSQGDQEEYYGINNMPDNNLSVLDKAIKVENRAHVRKIVNTLPEKYRRVIWMRYFNDMPYVEISEILRIPLGTVKAQIYRAKEILGERIKF